MNDKGFNGDLMVMFIDNHWDYEDFYGDEWEYGEFSV